MTCKATSEASRATKEQRKGGDREKPKGYISIIREQCNLAKSYFHDGSTNKSTGALDTTRITPGTSHNFSDNGLYLNCRDHCG